MNNKLSEIVSRIEDDRRSLLESVEGLSQSQMDARPAEGAWSVGEILNHLSKVEAGIVKLMQMQAAKAREKGLGPDTTEGSLLSSLDHLSLDKAIVKIDAPEQVRPEAGLPKDELLGALSRSRSELLSAAEGAAHHDFGQMIYTHPILGSLNMYQWLLFVGQHERRHTAQVRAVKEALSLSAEGAAN